MSNVSYRDNKTVTTKTAKKQQIPDIEKQNVRKTQLQLSKKKKRQQEQTTDNSNNKKTAQPYSLQKKSLRKKQNTENEKHCMH